MSIKRIMLIVFSCITALSVFGFVSILQLNNLVSEIDLMSDIRYKSYQSADELRQSSDDLTRLGRTYVITADEKYEKMYMDILDIRNGKKPRPENYHSIYWDLVLNYGDKPKPDGQTIALEKTMKKLGFTDQELGLLKEAQNNSDALVGLEVKAMNAVKGLYDNGDGRYEKLADPDFKLARELLHSQQYHSEKAKIMAPIDMFFQKLETRTKSQLFSALESTRSLVWLCIVIMMAVIFSCAVGYWIINRWVTSPIKSVTEVVHQVDQSNKLTLRLNDKFSTKDLQDISHSINKMLDGYRDTISSLRTVSVDVSELSKNVLAAGCTNNELSAEQREQLIVMSSAVGEMHSALRSIAENTNTAETHAADTEGFARNCEEIFNVSAEQFSSLQANILSSTSIINELAKESSKVGNVVDVIKGIAEQTNLLALNAAIEAARAGEQGRGFAVVADEVRSLAQRTQDSTGEIEQMISSLANKAVQATSSISSSEKMMNSTSEKFQSISEALKGIEHAAKGIHGLSTSIASATDKVLTVSEGITDNVDSISKIATKVDDQSLLLKNQAEQLSQKADFMHNSVKQFTV
jgi:methyl-accepting chemotaxis protein